MTGPAPGARAPREQELRSSGLVPSQRVLDPEERASEILFGLIMVIGITGTVSVTAGGQQSVPTMLRAAVGCNLAWGITDAVMYLLSGLVLRGRALLALRAIRTAADPRLARSVVLHVLPPAVARIVSERELDSLVQRLAVAPEPPRRPSLERDDFLAALLVCVLVLMSTFPVVIPFLLMDEPARALRVSHGIGIGMLFVLGWFTGRHAGARPWLLGLMMVLLGAALVALIVALGG